MCVLLGHFQNLVHVLALQFMPQNLPFHALVLADYDNLVGKHDTKVYNTANNG